MKDAASESEAKESELETPRGQPKAKKIVWEEDASSLRPYENIGKNATQTIISLLKKKPQKVSS